MCQELGFELLMDPTDANVSIARLSLTSEP
jgi:hypothetical protein